MDKLIPVEIVKEMNESYIDYSMSVIVARALPDVRDGLKPVHRRILYAMDNLNLTPDRPFKKSATIVGDVLGKYHPHGDSSVYDALVRLAQDFNLRYPLVQGHGNFGSIDGDSAAAYRYTEARMEKMALELLADIDKETVDMADNFDASLKEPSVLPSRIPNILVNGSMGIAVGMATNIPPHNLAEVVDAAVAMIDDPDIDTEDILDIVKGPDFPTGGTIMGMASCREAYRTGRGTITMRAKIRIEEKKNGKRMLIVDEIPYQLNKAKLIEQIASRIKEKRITHVTDLRDESNREGIRIVMELSQHANERLLLNQLYKHTNLQCNYGMIMLALVNGEPKLLPLRDILSHYIAHRKDVITRKTRFELKKSSARLHILEGLRIALDNIDDVVEAVRSASDNKEAKECLKIFFDLTDAQAQAILEMQLQRLTGLQRGRIDDEFGELSEKVKYLEGLLASENELMGVIKQDLLTVREKYADSRRTEIIRSEAEIYSYEDILPETDVVVTLSESGYIKRMPLEAYKAQKRGGKGIVGAGLKEEDYITNVCSTTSHNHLFFITGRGKMFRLKAYEIPETGRQSKGTAYVNLFPGMLQDEKIETIVPARHLSDDLDLVIATSRGYVKKTALSLYRHLGKSGIIACRLNEGDRIVGASIISNMTQEEFIVISRYGRVIRFDAKSVRNMGRNAAGVMTIKIEEEGDSVVSFLNAADGECLMIVTEKGFAVRTPLAEFPVKGRRGKGIRVMNLVADMKGFIAAARMVNDTDEVMVMTKDGIIMRTRPSELPDGGRYRQGNVFMKMNDGDSVSAVTVIRSNVAPIEKREASVDPEKSVESMMSGDIESYPEDSDECSDGSADNSSSDIYE